MVSLRWMRGVAGVLPCENQPARVFPYNDVDRASSLDITHASDRVGPSHSRPRRGGDLSELTEAEEKREAHVAVVTMKQLLESGVHFGHQARRWNPKMKRFIFMERNGIHIIDLQQTLTRVEEAYAFVRDLAGDGGQVLFVGTKKQAQESISEEAKRSGMHFVNQRCGRLYDELLTIRTLNRLKTARAQGAGDFGTMPRNALRFDDELRHPTVLPGVREIKLTVGAFHRRPDTASTSRRGSARLEIRSWPCRHELRPRMIDVIIHANDDAIRAVKLICQKMDMRSSRRAMFEEPQRGPPPGNGTHPRDRRGARGSRARAQRTPRGTSRRRKRNRTRRGPRARRNADITTTERSLDETRSIEGRSARRSESGAVCDCKRRSKRRVATTRRRSLIKERGIHPCEEVGPRGRKPCSLVHPRHGAFGARSSSRRDGLLSRGEAFAARAGAAMQSPR